MSSDTPRADAHNWNEGHYDDPLHSLLDFAKQLERELNVANERIKRLKEAGDRMLELYEEIGTDSYDKDAMSLWRKAKEAKP